MNYGGSSQVLHELCGKEISKIFEIDDFLFFEFKDGFSLEVHGGSVGYENANPWYELKSKKVNDASSNSNS